MESVTKDPVHNFSHKDPSRQVCDKFIFFAGFLFCTFPQMVHNKIWERGENTKVKVLREDYWISLKNTYHVKGKMDHQQHLNKVQVL